MRLPVAAVVVLLAAARSFATQTETLVEKERRRQAMDHYQKGRDAMTAERFEEAVAEFKAAIDLDPLYTIAYFRKGQAHMTLKEYAQAEQAFLACRRGYENLVGLQLSNSEEVERQREEVIRELENTMLHTPIEGPDQNAPSRPPTLEQHIAKLERQRRKTGQEATAVPAELNVSLGSAYFRQGKMDLAEKEWKTAVIANPKLGEAHNNLAALYLMTQNFDDAEKELELAEKAGYHVHPAPEGRHRGPQGLAELSRRGLMSPPFEVRRRMPMAKARRTTHRSSRGKKLYAVRDRKGRFKDIQTYERAHRADIARGAKAEAATKAKRKKATRRKARKKGR